ncbi:hypothetical protein CBM2606_A10147 [Cupriavidus taiwanensis]|nr:hypothetical protein CBM2606_A10147 [Cupriavidus taiwanensis]
MKQPDAGELDLQTLLKLGDLDVDFGEPKVLSSLTDINWSRHQGNTRVKVLTTSARDLGKWVKGIPDFAEGIERVKDHCSNRRRRNRRHSCLPYLGKSHPRGLKGTLDPR